MNAERARLLDIIGESDACSDDACTCHLAAWEAADRLEQLNRMDAEASVDRRAADALAIVSEGLLP